MYVDIYKENETMKMLGYQFYPMIYNDVVKKDVLNVIKAHRVHKGQDSYQLIADIFNLGVIWGKRNERSRHKGKYYNILGSQCNKAFH